MDFKIKSNDPQIPVLSLFCSHGRYMYVYTLCSTYISYISYTMAIIHTHTHGHRYMYYGKYEFWVRMHANQFVYILPYCKFMYNLTYLHKK